MSKLIDMGKRLLLCSILVLCVQIQISSSQKCNANAYGQGHVEGQCVVFQECPPLLRILKSPDKTYAEIRLLQNLTCIPDFVNPTICCAIDDLSYYSKYKYEVKYNSQSVPSNENKQNSVAAIIYPTELSVTISFINTTIPELPTKTSDKDINDPSLQPLDRFGKQIHKNFKLLPSLKDCSNPVGSSDRIIGGEQAPHGAYPWMARIGYISLERNSSNKTEFYCSGTVINKRYILLAAHCSVEIDLKLSTVRLGEYNTSSELDCSPILNCSKYEDYGVEKIIPHAEYYTVDKSNDIALIRVDRDISFDTSFIRPVCLPFAAEYKIEHNLHTDDLSQFVGTRGIVTGWGRQKWNRGEGSETLQEVMLPIVSNEECQKNYSSRIGISDLQICAGGEKKRDSCSGDSGGCLLVPVKIRDEKKRYRVKYFQLGVVSFGPVQCGVGGLPGVYSRVSKYKRWILDNLEP